MNYKVYHSGRWEHKHGPAFFDLCKSLLGWFFPQPEPFLTCWRLASCCPWIPGTLSPQCSLPSHICTWELQSPWASLDFQLRLLNSGRGLGSTWLPLWAQKPENSTVAGSYRNYRAHHICFPSSRDHCPFPDSQCFGNCSFKISCSFLVLSVLFVP